MTRERIAEGLELLLLQLANSETTAPPEGWLPHEWAYIKGIASSAIWIDSLSAARRSTWVRWRTKPSTVGRSNTAVAYSSTPRIRSPSADSARPIRARSERRRVALFPARLHSKTRAAIDAASRHAVPSSIG